MPQVVEFTLCLGILHLPVKFLHAQLRRKHRAVSVLSSGWSFARESVPWDEREVSEHEDRCGFQVSYLSVKGLSRILALRGVILIIVSRKGKLGIEVGVCMS